MGTHALRPIWRTSWQHPQPQLLRRVVVMNVQKGSFLLVGILVASTQPLTKACQTQMGRIGPCVRATRTSALLEVPRFALSSKCRPHFHRVDLHFSRSSTLTR